MFRRILVPLDGSRLAEQALAPALRLARRGDGALWLLRVPAYSDAGIQDISEYDLQWVETGPIQTANQAADYLREVKRGLKAAEVPVHAVVVDGNPCRAILNTAVSEDIDLIVMTTHARSGLARLVLGSVACEVMREAPCPVLILRGSLRLSTIVVALDGSQTAEEALGPALGLAGEAGSTVALLRVCDKRPGDQAQAERYLEEIRRRSQVSPRIVTAAPVWGAPGPAIVRYAAEQDADVIAMTTHGRTGWRRLIAGSVAEDVVRDTHCAVLVVPSRA